MLLKKLIKGIPEVKKNTFISGISTDSRKVKKNYIFFAIKGSIGNSFGIDIKRGSIFIKDRKLTRDYTQSNDAEYNFIKFYLTQLKSIIKKKIFLEKKKLKRYYGNKDKNNLSEIFLFTA